MVYARNKVNIICMHGYVLGSRKAMHALETNVMDGDVALFESASQEDPCEGICKVQSTLTMLVNIILCMLHDHSSLQMKTLWM